MPAASRVERPSRGRHALVVLWPAFVMAGVLEMLVFALVDPATLRGPVGEQPLGWSRNAVYSLGFLLFWAVIAASGAVTLWLLRSVDEERP